MAGRLLSLVTPSGKLSIIVGALSLLHSIPSPAYCQKTPGNDKDDDSTDDLFKEFVKKVDLGRVPKVPFDFDLGSDHVHSIHDFFKTQLEDGGNLQPVRKVFESGVAGQVGYSFLMGYSSGFCLRKVSTGIHPAYHPLPIVAPTNLIFSSAFDLLSQVSRMAAFVLGSAFILVQSLQYGGLIKVNYEGIQKKAEASNPLRSHLSPSPHFSSLPACHSPL